VALDVRSPKFGGKVRAQFSYACISCRSMGSKRRDPSTHCHGAISQNNASIIFKVTIVINVPMVSIVACIPLLPSLLRLPFFAIVSRTLPEQRSDHC
jgi:hypothetical protein